MLTPHYSCILSSLLHCFIKENESQHFTMKHGNKIRFMKDVLTVHSSQTIKSFLSCICRN